MTLKLQAFEDWPSVPDAHTYKQELEKHELRALQLQQRIHSHKRKAIIVFEGWDASGKGGAIRRFCQTLDPRGYDVYPVGPPTEEERARHYLWRFWRDLPAAGRLAIFDRSWYGRVLVERVDNLTHEDAWRRAYAEINEFEELLVNDETPVVKIYLHVSKHEQAKRFEERKTNPIKSWKLTESDWEAHHKYDAYYAAVNDMLERTNTAHAPWTVISANHKWYTRIQVMETIFTALDRHTNRHQKNVA